MELSEARNNLMPLVKESTGIRLTYTDLIFKIAAEALAENPEVNAAWLVDSIKLLRELNIGLAVFVQGEVIVPIIRRANLKSLAEITLARAALVDRARKLRIEPREVEGASITLTNVGMFGVDFVLAIINLLESCILAIGRITEKPVVHHGEVAIRPRMNLGLSFDHRVADGVMASRFLLKIKEIIEQPGSLMSKV